MALPLPNLDDRTYVQLVDEMIALLPRHNKEWTNQNPSDPGVMLLELFAYLIEMDIFQLNRIPNASYANFLKLVEVDTSAYSQPPTREEIEGGIVKALENLAYLRAISRDDMEQVVENTLLPRGIVSRFNIFSNTYIKKNYWENIPDIQKYVHAQMQKEGYTLIILSADNKPFIKEQDNPCLAQVQIDRTLPRYTLSDADLNAVREALRQRRMLTNRLYVHQAQIKRVIVYVSVFMEKTANEATIKEDIADNLLNYFCPVWGGEQETGFALGRPFKISEAIAVLEETEGVDYTDEFSAWYEEVPGVWRSISQIYEPEFYEQIWLESGVITNQPLPPLQQPTGITVEVKPYSA